MNVNKLCFSHRNCPRSVTGIDCCPARSLATFIGLSVGTARVGDRAGFRNDISIFTISHLVSKIEPSTGGTIETKEGIAAEIEIIPRVLRQVTVRAVDRNSIGAESIQIVGRAGSEQVIIIPKR